LTYQLVLRFFGLRPEDKDIVLEYIYALIRHLGFTYHDAYNLPVWKRTWFINKYVSEIKQKNENRKRNNPPPNNNANTTARRLFNRK